MGLPQRDDTHLDAKWFVRIGGCTLPTGNMEKISRRTLLGGAAVLPFAAAARGRHAMQYHLSCGALGVKANQKEAIGYAAQYGFDVVDADGKYLGGLSDSELHNLLDEMQSKQVGWAIAGLPVEFRKDDDTFSSGIKTFP